MARAPITIVAPANAAVTVNYYQDDNATACAVYADTSTTSTTSQPVTVAAGTQSVLYAEEQAVRVSCVLYGVENADGAGGRKRIYNASAGRIISPPTPAFPLNILAITPGAAPSFDPTLGKVQVINGANANMTAAFANPFDGAELILVIKQDATGSRTMTWGASVLAGPTLTTTASKTDVISLVYSAAIAKWVTRSTALNQ
jgi:hypothetical protein